MVVVMLLRRRRWRADPAEPFGALPGVDAQLTQAQAWRALTMPVTSLPAVVAARTLIADTIGQLTLVALRGGQPVPQQSPLVRRPDPTEPTWLTWHRLGMALTGPGHAWVLVTSWDTADRPSTVRVLDPATVEPAYDELGRPVEVTWYGRTYRVPSEVVHIPNVVADGDELGRSPLQLCGAALAQVVSVYGFRASYYDESGVPSVKITVPHRLTTQQSNDERDRYVASRAGRSLPVVVSGGADVQPFLATARDAQLSEAVDAGTAEVARVYRIPPSLLNAPSGDSLTYATVVDEFRRWLTLGLQAYLMRIEQAFSELLPRGQSARFDVSELARSAPEQRWDGYATALAGAPWLTVDEVRAAEGRPPLEVGALDDVAPVTAPNLEGV